MAKKKVRCDLLVADAVVAGYALTEEMVKDMSPAYKSELCDFLAGETGANVPDWLTELKVDTLVTAEADVQADEEFIVTTTNEPTESSGVLPVGDPCDMPAIESITTEQVSDTEHTVTVTYSQSTEGDSRITEMQRQIDSLERTLRCLPCKTDRETEILAMTDELVSLYTDAATAGRNYDEADKDAKTAKKHYESQRDKLEKMCGELDALKSGADYQKRLPFPDRGDSYDVASTPVAAVPIPAAVDVAMSDIGGVVSLDDLTKNGLRQHGYSGEAKGLTDKKIELLKHHVEGSTIAELERYWQGGGTSDAVESFGPEWVSRLSEAYGIIRDIFPMPSPDDVVETTETVQAVVDAMPEPKLKELCNALIDAGLVDGEAAALVDELEESEE